MEGCESSVLRKWELLWADEGVLNVKEKKEKDETIEKLKLAGLVVVGGVVAMALAAWGLSKIGLKDVGAAPIRGMKMMKAPGRNIYIPRDGFESNPSAYFRNLRKDG